MSNAKGLGFINPGVNEDVLNVEFTAITQTSPLVEKFSKKIMTEFNKKLETLNLSDRAITVGHDDVSLHNSNDEAPCKFIHTVDKCYGFSNGPWVAETPYIRHDYTTALGRGMTNNTVIVDDGPFLSLSSNPMLTNRICMYFYWAMLQKGSLKSTNFVIRKQNVRNRIVFNYTQNTSPLMRKLYKLFIKELKLCGDLMSVLYKYVDVKNDVLDNYVTALSVKNYKRFNKRFSIIKEKTNKHDNKSIALLLGVNFFNDGSISSSRWLKVNSI